MVTDATPPKGHKLTDEQWFTLRALADVIVPPSSQYAVPGAGDESICKNVIKDAAKRLPRLTKALVTLNQMARDAHDSDFAEMDDAHRETVALAFRDTHQGAGKMVETLVTQCYYRDDRILRSLGMEARPPFPQGYNMEPDDWSVLSDVQRRQPFHRPVD
jgi:hypothetical protein